MASKRSTAGKRSPKEAAASPGTAIARPLALPGGGDGGRRGSSSGPSPFEAPQSGIPSVAPADDGSGRFPPEHPVDDRTPDPKSVFLTAGRSGLQYWGGYLAEEWLRDLTGGRALRVFREMWDNDAIVGAYRFAIEMSLRRTDWTVQPGGDTPDDKAAADYAASLLIDMDHPWDDFIVEISSMLGFGWAWTEQLFKIRGGRSSDPRRRSRFDDGFIGWKKLAIRSQDSWRRWVFHPDTGDCIAFIQAAPPDYKEREIPRWKSLLFRTSRYKENPEGRSILRNAYRSWLFKKKIEELEGIGVERDLAGYPVIRAPIELFTAAATPEQQALMAELQKIVTQTRRDEREGAVLPFVPDHPELYNLELISAAGTRQHDTGAIVERLERAMAATVLADFIKIGHESVGSKALMATKTDLFNLGVDAWNDGIADEINTRGLPLLFELNAGLPGFPKNLTQLPKLVPGSVREQDLDQLSQLVSAIAGVGIDLTDAATANYLRRIAGLPERVDDDESEFEQDDDGDSRPAGTPPQKPTSGDSSLEDSEGAARTAKRAQVVKAALDRQAPAVRRAQGQVLTAWKSQRRAVEQALPDIVAAAGELRAHTIDHALHPVAHMVGTALKGALRPFMQAEARRAYQHGGRVLRAAGKVRKAAPIFDELGQAYLRGVAFARQITGIEQTTRGLVAKAISEGLAAGEDVSAIAERLSMSVWMDAQRALRIARTEVLGAANGAAVDGYASAGVPGKEWANAGDDRVRGLKLSDEFDHVEANGQIVPVDEPFLVSGEELMYPGDPEGSAGNIIECRCVALPALLPELAE